MAPRKVLVDESEAMKPVNCNNSSQKATNKLLDYMEVRILLAFQSDLFSVERRVFLKCGCKHSSKIWLLKPCSCGFHVEVQLLKCTETSLKREIKILTL